MPAGCAAPTSTGSRDGLNGDLEEARFYSKGLKWPFREWHDAQTSLLLNLFETSLSSLMNKIQIKRVYDPAAPTDGYRILVDRLWPRGVTKENAATDEWLREVAPSTELRRWFGHDPERWSEFKRRYLLELNHEPAAGALARLRELAARQPITLLYGAKDEAHNHAVLLLKLIQTHPS